MIKDLLFYGEAVGGDVGIEIEVEGDNLPYIDNKYWRSDKDGSLRAAESYEYVLKKPVLRKDVHKALLNINKIWERNNAIINDSFRAGIHVHVNVRDLTLIQMVNFSILYYIFEDILLKWCGEDRIGNHFCLSSKDADYVLEKLEDALVSNDLKSLYTDSIRYSSLNYKALIEYGSLEFRGMRSTSDVKVIEEWVNILLSLKDYAIKMDNPSKIIGEFSIKGALGLANTVFKGIPLDFDVESMYNGMRRVQSIAYCVDWDNIKPKTIHIPLDLKPMEPVNNELFEGLI